MRIEELELVCQEAARNLVQRGDRPVPASVVLPLPTKTSVTALEHWPDDDNERTVLLERFADDVMRPANAPCYGFVAEAIAAADGDRPVDVVVIVYGARRNHPRISAAPLLGEARDELGEFTPPEPLEPIAMPFMAA